MAEQYTANYTRRCLAIDRNRLVMYMNVTKRENAQATELQHVLGHQNGREVRSIETGRDIYDSARSLSSATLGRQEEAGLSAIRV